MASSKLYQSFAQVSHLFSNNILLLSHYISYVQQKSKVVFIIVCVKVVVGGSASGWGPLEDNFTIADERLWLLHPGGTHMPVCGSDGKAFAFIEKSNTRYAVTTDISVGHDAVIQFDFSASCSVTSSCYCKKDS